MPYNDPVTGCPLQNTWSHFWTGVGRNRFTHHTVKSIAMAGQHLAVETVAVRLGRNPPTKQSNVPGFSPQVGPPSPDQASSRTRVVTQKAMEALANSICGYEVMYIETICDALDEGNRGSVDAGKSRTAPFGIARLIKHQAERLGRT